MTNQEAERILNPATSREALLPYALDCQHRMALLDEACRVACAALRGPQWISVKERLPENEDFVFVAVTGKYRNIRFDHAVEIGAYYSESGWELEPWPMWENPGVTHWMPLPNAPEEGTV